MAELLAYKTQRGFRAFLRYLLGDCFDASRQGLKGFLCDVSLRLLYPRLAQENNNKETLLYRGYTTLR